MYSVYLANVNDNNDLGDFRRWAVILNIVKHVARFYGEQRVDDHPPRGGFWLDGRHGILQSPAVVVMETGIQQPANIN